jgi:hypothetical protein
MSISERRLATARALSAAIACAAFAFAAPVRAQSQDEAAARTLFNQGRQLVKTGHYEEACGKFEAARALFRSPGVLLNLADCHERIGKTASAWTEFGDAADSAASAGRTRDADEARKRQTALEPALCMLEVRVDAAAADEVVKRGVAPLDHSAWNVPIPVDPGPQTITAEAPGRRPWSTSVDVSENGKTVTVRVPALDEVVVAQARPAEVAAPSGNAAPLPEAPVADDKANPGHGQRTVAWVVGGAGLAAMAAAGVVSILARSQFDTAENERASNGPQAAADSHQAGNVADIATALVIGGGALTATGLVLWLSAPRAHVAVGLNGPAVVVAGTF